MQRKLFIHATSLYPPAIAKIYHLLIINIAYMSSFSSFLAFSIFSYLKYNRRTVLADLSRHWNDRGCPGRTTKDQFHLCSWFQAWELFIHSADQPFLYHKRKTWDEIFSL